MSESKIIKYVIIDDEENCIKDLRWELKGCGFSVEEVAVFTIPENAIGRLNQLDLDLLFLDVSMPGMDGFDMLNALKSIRFDIVFTTAFDQYAIKAFQHNAIDYLLKPVSAKELDRVLEKHLQNRYNDQMKHRLKELNKLYEELFGKLAIYTKEGYQYLSFQDIVRLEAQSNYTAIYTETKKYILSYPMKEYEKKLPDSLFIKVHRSHIVNTQFITGVNSCAVLKNGETIPVSKSKISIVKNFLFGEK